MGKRGRPKSMGGRSEKVAKAASVASSSGEASTSLDKMALNAEYFVELDKAMETIKGAAGMADIEALPPLPIARANSDCPSGFQTAFKQADFTNALASTAQSGTHAQYQCGMNMFCASLTDTVMKGVPYRREGVRQLEKFYFGDGGDPGFFPSVITVALDGPDVDVMANLGKMVEVSPEEVRHASIFACAADIEAGCDTTRLEKWKTFFLTATVRFVVVSGDDRYFMAVTLRNAARASNDAVTRTAFQQICELNIFRERLEAKGQKNVTPGALAHMYKTQAMHADSSEEITESFADMVMTLWRRTLSIPEVLHVVRLAEEKYGLNSIFDSACKMQTITSRAGAPDNIKWSFQAIYDMSETGALKDGVGTRYLAGLQPHSGGKGLVDEILYKRSLLNYIIGEWMESKNFFNNDEKTGIRNACVDFPTHRAKCGCSWIDTEADHVDLTWRAGWSSPADAIMTFLELGVFGAAHDPTINKALRDRKQPSEVIETGSLKALFEEIDEMIQAQTAKDKDGEPKSTAVAEEAPAAGEVAHEVVVVQFMKTAGVEDSTAARVQEAGNLDKVAEARSQAKRLLNTYVSLVVENSSESKTGKAIEDTPAGAAQAATREVRNQYVAIFDDVKLSGEATSQPHVRQPPFRSTRWRKLAGAVMKARGYDSEIPDGDMWIIPDGFKPGNDGAIMAAFSTEGEAGTKAKPMAKTVKRLHLVYTEDSFRERLGCVRGGLNLMEDITIITGRATEYPEKNRDMFNAFSKTTKGNVVGGVAWHPWAKSWQAPVATKKFIFGAANRIDVGGPTPEGTKRDPPKPTDVEPVFYHSLQPEYATFLLREFPISAGIDLSPGEGHLALAFVKAKKPYTGVCFTEKHKDMLADHIASLIFACKLQEGDPLYDPSLAELLSSKKKKAETKKKGDPNDPNAKKKTGDPNPLDATPPGQKKKKKNGTGKSKDKGGGDGSGNSKEKLLSMLAKLREGQAGANEGETGDGEEEPDDEEEDSHDEGDDD